MSLLRRSLATVVTRQNLQFRLFATAGGSNSTTKKPKTREEIVRERTPIGRLDEKPETKSEKETEDVPQGDPWLPRHKGGVNPTTGERGGPAGVEPTRYGDWERKGRVSDF